MPRAGALLPLADDTPCVRAGASLPTTRLGTTSPMGRYVTFRRRLDDLTGHVHRLEPIGGGLENPLDTSLWDWTHRHESHIVDFGDRDTIKHHLTFIENHDKVSRISSEPKTVHTVYPGVGENNVCAETSRHSLIPLVLPCGNAFEHNVIQEQWAHEHVEITIRMCEI